MKPILIFLIVSSVLFSQNKDEVVKKSKTGICHPPSSPHYSRTKNFTPYNSVQDCLNSGGRLPKR